MEQGMAKYRQIAEKLRAEIVSGQYDVCGRLPSQAQPMERFDVAQMTVRQAVGLLKEWGLVEPEHGRGVFLKAPPE